MAKYPIIKPGEWVKPKRKFYKMACCDCGLVHRMEFDLIPFKGGKGIVFRCWRDIRATVLMRRQNGITVKQK